MPQNLAGGLLGIVVMEDVSPRGDSAAQEDVSVTELCLARITDVRSDCIPHIENDRTAPERIMSAQLLEHSEVLPRGRSDPVIGDAVH